MAGPNYAGKAVGGLTHIGLTPVQAGVTVADAVGTSVKTVLDTGRNLLKTLAYPFTSKTWKPKWKEDYKKTWKGFSDRQKDHWNSYVAPFKGDGNKAPLLAKATGGITHFATAIPANAIMTTLDATYSAVKTPFSILKNTGKTLLYPFTSKTWKPTFGKDLKEIWGKEKGFAARTSNSWKEVFDVMPEKGSRGGDDKIEDEGGEEDENETMNTQIPAKPEIKPVEKKTSEAPKAENKSDGKTNNGDKTPKNSNDKEKTDSESEKGKVEKEELKKDTIITRDTIKDNPDTIFVFGDNLEAKKSDTEAVKQKGENKDIVEKSGGQAKEMRAKIKNGKKDISNSFGIPTMKNFGECMNDGELDENKKNIDESINEIKSLSKGKKIHIPFDKAKNQYNIGTGISDLENNAPQTFKYLQEELKKLDEGNTKNSRGYETNFRGEVDKTYSMAA